MKEITLKGYFDGDKTAEDLSVDLKGCRVRNGRDSITMHVEEIDAEDNYIITRQHLLKLCQDALNGHISDKELNTIAFILSASDYFEWDNVGTEDYKIVDSTIFDWDNPGIGIPITIDNLKLWKIYLETGEYKLDPKAHRSRK